MMKNQVDPRLLSQALAASADALAIAEVRGPDMPLVYVNRAFERLTGYAAAEVLGQNSRFLQRGHSTPLDIALTQGILQHGGPWVVTVREQRRDGSPFWNELSLTPLRAGGERVGRITHILGKLTDVTARVMMEQKRAEYQQRLLAEKRALEDLALKDVLTGLHNRRAFNEQFEREWNRARRDRTPLSLFMIDIDHFKHFNDTYGHLAGDRCIQAVAATIKYCFARGADLTARFGGEEFVVLAAGVERDHAYARAERLRLAVRAMPMRHGDDAQVSVSVSVGCVTAVPQSRVLPEDLLGAADRALYRAKRQGRNQVVQATEFSTLASAA